MKSPSDSTPAGEGRVDLVRIVRNLLRWQAELRNIGEQHLSDHVDLCMTQAAALLASAAEDLEERLESPGAAKG